MTRPVEKPDRVLDALEGTAPDLTPDERAELAAFRRISTLARELEEDPPALLLADVIREARKLQDAPAPWWKRLTTPGFGLAFAGMAALVVAVVALPNLDKSSEDAQRMGATAPATVAQQAPSASPEVAAAEPTPPSEARDEPAKIRPVEQPAATPKPRPQPAAGKNDAFEESKLQLAAPGRSESDRPAGSLRSPQIAPRGPGQLAEGRSSKKAKRETTTGFADDAGKAVLSDDAAGVGGLIGAKELDRAEAQSAPRRAVAEAEAPAPEPPPPPSVAPATAAPSDDRADLDLAKRERSAAARPAKSTAAPSGSDALHGDTDGALSVERAARARANALMREQRPDEARKALLDARARTRGTPSYGRLTLNLAELEASLGRNAAARTYASEAARTGDPATKAEASKVLRELESRP
ncbi:MAG: hypothetical protein HYV07_33855 [Deltaproteobacteria bacterium]|nr:hypothetical protein [Deltaproteobacteria bacterium]